MKEISIGEAQRLTSPNPFSLLTVRKPDGSTNVMALSWWTYTSNNPPSVAVCLSNKGYSGECIKTTKAFGLSLPGPSVQEAAFRAGTCSGREMDKAAALGLPLVTLEGFSQQMVQDSRICFSCKLVNAVDLGDHTLYVGEIDKMLADPQTPALFACEGYGRLTTVTCD